VSEFTQGRVVVVKAIPFKFKVLEILQLIAVRRGSRKAFFLGYHWAVQVASIQTANGFPDELGILSSPF
jgi:hypothetical protein